MSGSVERPKKGDRVTIQGLEENKQFNGQAAEVQGFRKGRVDVRVVGLGLRLLLRPANIGMSDSLWMPVEPPSLRRQNSFELVRLVREQRLSERVHRQKFLRLLSRPYDSLSPHEDAEKYSLFLQEGKRGKGGTEMYLLSALPRAALALPLSALSHVFDYAGLGLARFSMRKRGCDLMQFLNVRRRLSIASGASLSQLTAEKLLLEKVRPRLRESFGSLLKPDLPVAEENKDAEGSDVDWEWDDGDYDSDGSGGSDDQDAAESKGAPVDPSDTAARTKEILPAGLQYLELGILLECLAEFFVEVAGTPWGAEEKGVAEVIEISSTGEDSKRAKPAKPAAEQKKTPKPSPGGLLSRGKPVPKVTGRGYTGQQGETKAIAEKIRLKKLESLVRDQVSGVMMGAVAMCVQGLRTAGRVDAEHLKLVSESCLNPLLAAYLRHSFMAIAERQDLYLTLLKTAEVIACDPILVATLFKPAPGSPGAGSSRAADLYGVLIGLKQQVDLYLKSPREIHQGDTEMMKLYESAQEYSRILAAVESRGRAFAKARERASRAAARAGKSGAGEAPADEKDAGPAWVREALGRLAIDFVDLQGSKIQHIFLNEAKRSPAGAKLSARLTKEVGSMMSGLPPGIFVRVDRRRMDLMRVCLTGPEGSPYQNGLFFFDVFFPYNYPAVPPKMKIITTGRATFRFNANLYTNGKVCLSLLGTWSGPGWEPSYSTLLQVLISIQAMILGTDEPIANEPGWERDLGTEKSRRYNAILSHGTMLYAMYEHLKSPVPGFEMPIRLHFWGVKDKLLSKQLPAWEKAIKKAGPSEAGPYRRENAIPEKIPATLKKTYAALRAMKEPSEAKDNADDGSDADEESDDDDF